MIHTKIIADSVAENGCRITTLSLIYPRFILAELNTHRMLSKNSASSRAIPVKKMIEKIQSDKAYPVFWGKNKSGMQAEIELDYSDKAKAIHEWNLACIDAIYHAKKLIELGLHKQTANRILEPFMHSHTVITGTEWDNFYNLRRHKDAQPEIKVLADSMFEEMQQSNPVFVKYGDWHKPYCDEDESLARSVARCARVSYMNHDGKSSSLEKDIDLANKLSLSGHWSPFEHQATPLAMLQKCDNFNGWEQLRRKLIYDANYAFC